MHRPFPLEAVNATYQWRITKIAHGAGYIKKAGIGLQDEPDTRHTQDDTQDHLDSYLLLEQKDRQDQTEYG